MLVRLAGHYAQTAYTAQHALELAASSDLQVILADIGLPDMDGYALAQRIRAMPEGRCLTLIAISGWGQDEDRRRATEAGFDSHLTKPIEPESVEALLQLLDARLNSPVA
jgi:CheY-like chemotaxis protein